jgi:predicted small secreted protein
MVMKRFVRDRGTVLGPLLLTLVAFIVAACNNGGGVTY